MVKRNVEIQDHQGNIYYPHTSSDVVFGKDGTPVSKQIVDKLNKTCNVKDKAQLIEPIDFAWLPYYYSNENFCGIGCNNAGALQIRVGTNNVNKSLFDIGYHGVATINGKQIATTEKIDISLLNGNKNELTPTFTPMASKSGNVATVNMTFEFYNPNICIVPFPPIVTTYFRAESLLSEQTYRGVIYKDGRINMENVPANGTRIVINLSYPCV